MKQEKKKRNRVFIIALAACFLTLLMQTITTTALPAIMKEFRIPEVTAQWITSICILAAGIVSPTTAFLIKRFPTKKLFLTTMFIFAGGALVAAIAPSFVILIIGRVMQAIGGGIMIALTHVMILQLFPIEERGKVFGLYGMAVAFAPIIAPIFAGFMVDLFSWRTIFWVVFVLATFVILMTFFGFFNIMETQKLHFDFLSFLLSGIGLSCLLASVGNLGTSPLLSMKVTLPFILGVASLTLFVFRQLALEKPFLDLRTLKNRELHFGIIGIILIRAAIMATATLIPIYCQKICGYSATVSALTMIPGGIILAVVTPIAGKIYDKIGPRLLLIVGSIFSLIGCAGVGFFPKNIGLEYLTTLNAIGSFGLACTFLTTLTWSMSTIHKNVYPDASALYSSMQFIAGAFGTTGFSVVMAVFSLNGSVDTHGFKAAYIGLTIMLTVVLILFTTVVRNRSNSRKEA